MWVTEVMQQRFESLVNPYGSPAILFTQQLATSAQITIAELLTSFNSYQGGAASPQPHTSEIVRVIYIKYR
jgi:hypothetical protein